MTSEFNPIDYAERLASEGVPANQANVHARALAEVLARCTVQPRELMETKTGLQADMADFRHHVDVRFIEVQNGIDLRFTEMKGDIDLRFTKMQSDIDVRFAAMQGQINTFRTDLQRQITMLKWMLGAVLTVQIGILLKLIN